jgi:hypothetical protein
VQREGVSLTVTRSSVSAVLDPGSQLLLVTAEQMILSSWTSRNCGPRLERPLGVAAGSGHDDPAAEVDRRVRLDRGCHLIDDGRTELRMPTIPRCRVDAWRHWADDPGCGSNPGRLCGGDVVTTAQRAYVLLAPLVS